MSSLVEERLKHVVRTLGGEKSFLYVAKAREVAERKKIRVISFGIGQPDIPTFDPIIEEAKKALDGKFTGYTETPGIKPLREAIADYLNNRYGAGVEADEVIVTTGAKTAIFLAISAFISEGDEVLIPDPAYPAYAEVTKLFGGRPVYIPLRFDPKTGFSLSIDDIGERITSRSKMIVINNPHNPTGAVFSPKDLQSVLDIAKRHKLLVLVDEIYDNFVYESGAFKGVLELEPSWRDYVLYVNGFSKTFSMTGWRLGYIVANKRVIDALRRLATNVYSCPPSFAQAAAIRALRDPKVWDMVKEMISIFKRRLDVIYSELLTLPHVEVWKSKGAFYIYPRVADLLKKVGMDVETFVEWLLEEVGVVILPGTAFSETEQGREFVRFSFALNEKDIREGIARIREAISTKLSS